MPKANVKIISDLFTVKSFSFKVINNISIYTSAARKKHKLEILLAPIFIVLTNIKKKNYYHNYTLSISLFHSFRVRSKNYGITTFCILSAQNKLHFWEMLSRKLLFFQSIPNSFIGG